MVATNPPPQDADIDLRPMPAAPTADVEIGILGPLRVVCDGEERAGRGGAHRLLLSVLAAEARSLSVDELLDVLSQVRPERPWGRQHVYSAAGRLRREFPGVVLNTRGAYALDRSRCVVDVERFESLARQARSDLVGGEAPSAVARLREALALWRGTALDEWRVHARAEAICTRLEEIRLGALEDLARALVAAGAPGDAVDVSRELLEAHPEREHTWASLLMALDALGSTDEVWRTFDEARRLLAEAGLEPGVELEQVMGRLTSPGVPAPAPTPVPGGPSTLDQLPPLVRLATEGPLVGRDRELATLQQVTTSVLEGGGARLVLLEGAAGVGKTRLAAEVAARGFEMGAAVWFEIGEDRLEAPHGPMTNFVRRLIDGLEPSERQRALEGPLGSLIGGIDRGNAADRDRFRWTLFDAVAHLVVRSIPAGAVLVVDDLHNVPVDGVNLIRHLLVSRPECRLLLVVTDRADTARVARADPNRELRRLPLAVTMRLGDLTAEGAVELMADLSGSALDTADQQQRLMELTHGNPLLISAVANDPELCEEVRSGSRHAPLAVASVAAQVAGLLGRLDESSAAVLEAAAVIGQRFDRRVLWSLDRAGVSFNAGAVNEALATAVRSGLIAADAADPNEFRFVHDLARRGIYDTLDATERAKLHWSVGTAVARLSTAEERTTVLAHHLLAAWPVCPTGEVVDHLQAAALEAVHALAVRRADHLFDLAVDVAAGDPSGLADEARCMLLLLAGVTRFERRRNTAAAALVREAIQIAKHHGWQDEVGYALAGLADKCRALALPSGARELLRYGSGITPVLREELLQLLHEADDEVAEAAERAALTVAGRADDLATVAATLSALARSGLGARRLHAAEQLTHLGESAGDPGVEGLGRVYEWIARVVRGETTFDDDAAVHIDELARSSDLPQLWWTWRAWRAVVALHHAGDADAAAEWLEGWWSVGLGRREDDPWSGVRTGRVDIGLKLLGAAIADARGDTARYRMLQSEALEHRWRRTVDIRSLQMALHARFGELDDAARLCEEVIEDGLLQRPPNANWLVEVIHVTQACARLGDTAAARTLIPLLSPHRHLHVVLDIAFYYGSVERYLGLLRGTCEEWDAAIAATRAAIDRHDRAKAVTVNIQTYQQLAWALTHRGGVGDREAAAGWRDRATDLAASIGAKAVADDPWACGD